MLPFTLALVVVASPVLHAQAPALDYGERVRLRGVGAPDTVIVVGLPDDRIRVDAAGVSVNDLPVTGFSPAFLTRATELVRNLGIAGVVPADHYVVMGEARVNQDIREYVGLHPRDALNRR